MALHPTPAPRSARWALRLAALGVVGPCILAMLVFGLNGSRDGLHPDTLLDLLGLGAGFFIVTESLALTLAIAGRKTWRGRVALFVSGTLLVLFILFCCTPWFRSGNP